MERKKKKKRLKKVFVIKRDSEMTLKYRSYAGAIGF